METTRSGPSTSTSRRRTPPSGKGRRAVQEARAEGPERGGRRAADARRRAGDTRGGSAPMRALRRTLGAAGASCGPRPSPPGGRCTRAPSTRTTARADGAHGRASTSPRLHRELRRPNPDDLNVVIESGRLALYESDPAIWRSCSSRGPTSRGRRRVRCSGTSRGAARASRPPRSSTETRPRRSRCATRTKRTAR